MLLGILDSHCLCRRQVHEWCRHSMEDQSQKVESWWKVVDMGGAGLHRWE